MSTIEDLAQQMHDALEQCERTSGEHEPGLSGYWRLKDGSPGWMRNVAMAAHADMLPDDWRYEFIEDAAGTLALGGDPDDAAEALHEYIYTFELTGWLHSHLQRQGYADEAMAEWGSDMAVPESITSILTLGMAKEQREVLGLVLEALQEVSESVGEPA